MFKYCEIIFICWTFNFLYFVGRTVNKFKRPMKFLSNYFCVLFENPRIQVTKNMSIIVKPKWFQPYLTEHVVEPGGTLVPGVNGLPPVSGRSQSAVRHHRLQIQVQEWAVIDIMPLVNWLMSSVLRFSRKSEEVNEKSEECYYETFLFFHGY